VLLLDGISLVAFSAVIDGVSSVCYRWCDFSVGWHCACCVEWNGIIFAFVCFAVLHGIRAAMLNEEPPRLQSYIISLYAYVTYYLGSELQNCVNTHDTHNDTLSLTHKHKSIRLGDENIFSLSVRWPQFCCVY